jgi:hypothetical protein
MSARSTQNRVALPSETGYDNCEAIVAREHSRSELLDRGSCFGTCRPHCNSLNGLYVAFPCSVSRHYSFSSSTLKEGSALSASRTSVRRLASRSRSCLDSMVRPVSSASHCTWSWIARRRRGLTVTRCSRMPHFIQSAGTKLAVVVKDVMRYHASRPAMRRGLPACDGVLRLASQ